MNTADPPDDREAGRPEPELRFTVRRDGPTMVIALRGDVDLDAEPVLAVAADRLDGFEGPVRVDLADVPYLDSTGVHFLVRLHRRCVEHGSDFTITGTRPLPARTLAMCGLTDLMSAPPGPVAGHERPHRYAVTVPDNSSGRRPPQVVVVHHRNDGTYADGTGRFRVSIHGAVATPLSGTDTGGRTCLDAHPLP